MIAVDIDNIKKMFIHFLYIIHRIGWKKFWEKSGKQFGELGDVHQRCGSNTH